MERNVPDTSRMERVLSAEELLRQAIEAEFETVIIFGFKGDGIHSSYSDMHNVLELIGALEAAKKELWEG